MHLINHKDPMILWEISSFNKLFRTDNFTRIRGRCKDNHRIYVVSNIKKLTMEIYNVQAEDIYPDNEEAFIKEYNVNSKDVSKLYLFESIRRILVMNNFINEKENKIYKEYITLGCNLI